MLGDGSSGPENSPTGFVPPEFVIMHQPRIEEASNRRRRKRASPDDPPKPHLDVQDLTGDKQPAPMLIRHSTAASPHALRHICSMQSVQTGISAQIAHLGKGLKLTH